MKYPSLLSNHGSNTKQPSNRNNNYETMADPITSSIVNINPLNNIENVSHDTISSIQDSFNEPPSNIGLLGYYLPCSAWIKDYTLIKFIHDLIAGFSLASFQIPLSISYASSLAHVDPLSGLYALGITPFVYAIFGSVPSMIVGPEAAISLVIGQTVEKYMAHQDEISSIRIIVVTTFLSGLILLIVGILRLGFLGSILSRALLRGFISSVGFVMILNSSITELKLNRLLRESPEHYHTPFEKILFLIKYGFENYHKATLVLSLIVFTFLVLTRWGKRKLTLRHKWIIFFPEFLIVIIGVTLLSYQWDFKEQYGISIVGEFDTNGFDHLKNPIDSKNRSLMPLFTQLSIIIATLGFFESTTASKALGGIDNSIVSSNRELIALGLMNVVGSTFGVLPSFGGYGRSKINLKSGAKTVIAGVCMGAITLLTAKYFLPAIYYIPNCVLSVITTLVGFTLLEDTPHDVMFHINCHGYNELFVFLLTVLTTFFYSVELGICIGCLYSVITIIKHSAKSRIQILARIQGSNHFINVIDYMDFYEEDHKTGTLVHIEGCLLVKIPEPLTFTNTEDLKERLDRVKRFGSTNAHPGSKQVSTENIKYVIFDLHGVTFLDSSAAQILYEIIIQYQNEGSFVFITRAPRKFDVRERLMESGITSLLKNDLIKINLMLANRHPLNPYCFKNVEDALMLVNKIKQGPSKLGQVGDLDSIISKTLVNSNLV